MHYILTRNNGIGVPYNEDNKMISGNGYVFLEMGEHGELVLYCVYSGIGENVRERFETETLKPYIFQKNGHTCFIVDGAVRGLLAFDPRSYTDDRIQQFLQKGNCSITAYLINSKNIDRVEEYREMWLTDEAWQEIADAISEANKVNLNEFSNQDYIDWFFATVYGNTFEQNIKTAKSLPYSQKQGVAFAHYYFGE